MVKERVLNLSKWEKGFLLLKFGVSRCVAYFESHRLFTGYTCGLAVDFEFLFFKKYRAN